MINETLLRTHDDMNSFTERVKAVCEKNGFALVRLRNKHLMEVVFVVGEEGEEDRSATFEAKEESFCFWWYADGSSAQNRDHDLIETVGDDGDLAENL